MACYNQMLDTSLFMPSEKLMKKQSSIVNNIARSVNSPFFVLLLWQLPMTSFSKIYNSIFDSNLLMKRVPCFYPYFSCDRHIFVKYNSKYNYFVQYTWLRKSRGFITFSLRKWQFHSSWKFDVDTRLAEHNLHSLEMFETSTNLLVVYIPEPV